MTPEKKIESLNLDIPIGKPKALGSYVPIVKVNDLVFISGPLIENLCQLEVGLK